MAFRIVVMKQELSHIDDHSLRDLMDESKLLLKLANKNLFSFSFVFCFPFSFFPLSLSGVEKQNQKGVLLRFDSANDGDISYGYQDLFQNCDVDSQTTHSL